MCCGRNNTSPARVPQSQMYATVGDARVPTIQWVWRSVLDAAETQTFESEPEARAWIADGHPGTLTPKYI
jgi:hypothetical protein